MSPYHEGIGIYGPQTLSSFVYFPPSAGGSKAPGEWAKTRRPADQKTDQRCRGHNLSLNKNALNTGVGSDFRPVWERPHEIFGLE